MSTTAAQALPLLDGVEQWHAALARLIIALPVAASGPAEREAYLAECTQAFAAAGDDGFGETLVTIVEIAIALWSGDLAGRRRAAERRLEIAHRMGDPVATVLPQVELAEVALQEDDPEHAAALLVEASESARPLRGGMINARLVATAAAVAATRSDWVRASQLFGAADGLLERSGAQINVGTRVEVDEGVARCRSGLGEVAFDRAWQTGWKLSGDTAMAMAGDVLAGHKPESGDGALTVRQSEVAELVAKGMSNREIAVALTISEHTAERHIENILKSLRLNSRVQIATWFITDSSD